MSYDVKCKLLAEMFLSDHPAIKTEDNENKLAQEIQTTIEDWIESVNNEQWTQGRTHYND